MKLQWANFLNHTFFCWGMLPRHIKVVRNVRKRQVEASCRKCGRLLGTRPAS